MVSIRTQADLSEVWSEIISGKNLILWCDGLKDNSFNKKRKQCQSLNHDENVTSSRGIKSHLFLSYQLPQIKGSYH